MVAFQNGDYAVASQHFNTAHSLATANDAELIAAEALYNLGNCALANEDYASVSTTRRQWRSTRRRTNTVARSTAC